jgi:hypothetical protein
MIGATSWEPDFERDPKLTYAGDCRALGITLPDSIPDCAHVPRESIVFGKPETEKLTDEEIDEGMVSLSLPVVFTVGFEWVVIRLGKGTDRDFAEAQARRGGAVHEDAIVELRERAPLKPIDPAPIEDVALTGLDEAIVHGDDTIATAEPFPAPESDDETTIIIDDPADPGEMKPGTREKIKAHYREVFGGEPESDDDE